MQFSFPSVTVIFKLSIYLAKIKDARPENPAPNSIISYNFFNSFSFLRQ